MAFNFSNRTIVKIVIPLVIASMLWIHFVPTTNAQLGSFLSCAGTGILQSLIQTGLNTLTNLLGGFLQNVFGTQVPVNEGFLRAKESNVDIVLRCAATQIYQRMNTNVVDIIRTAGRTLQNPQAFVRNWRNFQTDAQYRGEDVFRAILADTNLCAYMGQEVRNLFNANVALPIPGSQNLRIGELDPFRLRANCSLPPTFNLQTYNQNFADNGGWEAYLRLSQPQNNVYGVLNLAYQELNKQRGLEQSSDIYETLGHGYTGRRGNGPISNCLVVGINGKCVVYRDILTPGSNLEESINIANQSHFQYALNADEINELLVSGLGVLTNRLLNLAVGALTGDDYQPVNAGNDVPNVVVPTPETNPVTGFNCSLIEGSSQYDDEVADAVDDYLDDPVYSSILNSSPIDAGAVDQYLQGVAGVLLQNENDILTSRVVGPNGVIAPDAIGVWREGSDYIEYYDILNEGAATISSGAQVQFMGLVSISCASGGTLLPPIDTVQLCERNMFMGECELFPSDDPDINMSVASVRVPSGTTVWLCNDTDYFCGCDELNGEVSDPSYGGPSSSLTYSEPCEDTNCNHICDSDEPACTFEPDGCDTGCNDNDNDGICDDVDPDGGNTPPPGEPPPGEPPPEEPPPAEPPSEEPPPEGGAFNGNSNETEKWYSGLLSFLDFGLGLNELNIK